MKTKKIITEQKGGALVESAIVLPLLILLFAGIVEFSICYYNKHVITNASREAARAGIDGSLAESDLRDIINVYCFGDGGSDGYNDEPRLITFGSGISTFPSCPAPSCIEITNGGTDLKVNVKYVYNFLLPSFIGVGSSITLYGETQMDMF